MVKIALGGAQFGLAYGVSNAKTVPVDIAELDKIIHFAIKNNIDCIDTAPAYGHSEKAIGEVLSQHAYPIKVITKVAKTERETAFVTSLANLRALQVYGLIIHDANDLLGPDGPACFEWMQGLKTAGKVEKLGCSFYTRDQMECVLSRFPMDMIQVPANIFDQRLTADGYVAQLEKQGLEIYIRSVFLQGSIFLSPEQLPGNIQKTGAIYLAKFNALRCQYHLTALELALLFFKSFQHANLVIGVTSLQELIGITEAFKKIQEIEIKPEVFWDLACEDEVFLNPSRWERKP